MKAENHSNVETPGDSRKRSGIGGAIKELGRDVGKDLLRETGTTIKWTVVGALFGAVALGGLGLWKFGAEGLVIGAVVGAVVGGAAGVWVYFSI